jgi:hypothetical protein
MNKLLSKKPVPLYIEAYLCSPSEELANVIIDIVDIVPFSNISYPVKAARGMVDPNVTEDKVNKVIELGSISTYYPEKGTFSIKIADYYKDAITSMISDDKAFTITPYVIYNNKTGKGRIVKFTVEQKTKSELSTSTPVGVDE